MTRIRRMMTGGFLCSTAAALFALSAGAQVYPNQAHAFYNVIPLGTNACTYQQVYAAAQFGSDPIQISSFAFAPDTGYNGQTVVYDTMKISLGYTDLNPGNLSSDLPSNVRGSLTQVLDDPGYTAVINSSGTEDFSLEFPFDTPFCYDPGSGNLLIQIEVVNNSINCGTSRCAGIPDASRAFNSSVFGNGADNVAQRIDFTIAPCSGGGFTLNLGGTCPGTVRVSWSGAEPQSTMGILFAGNTGNYTLPGGPCAGTQLGLGTQNLRLVTTLNSGGNGSGNVNGNANQSACGGYLQLVVVGNPCQTSNVEQLP